MNAQLERVGLDYSQRWLIVPERAVCRILTTLCHNKLPHAMISD